MSLAPDDHRHGTMNGYTNLGCRCNPCRKAWAEYHWAYMERHPEQREKARQRTRRWRAGRDMSRRDTQVRRDLSSNA